MGVCGYGSDGISIQVLGAGAGSQEGQGSPASLSGHSAADLLGLVCGQTTMAHIALFARMHWPALKEPLGYEFRMRSTPATMWRNSLNEPIVKR